MNATEREQLQALIEALQSGQRVTVEMRVAAVNFLRGYQYLAARQDLVIGLHPLLAVDQPVHGGRYDVVADRRLTAFAQNPGVFLSPLDVVVEVFVNGLL